MVRRRKETANPLFQEATPEVLRDKIFELAAMNYTPLVISIMLEGMYEPIRISERHINDFLALNRGGIVKWQNRLKNERVPTRAELIRRATDLLMLRFKRAVADFKAFEELSEERRNNQMTEETYQQKTKTLYLPTSLEMINLINAIDKKMVGPAKDTPNPSGTGEPDENQEPKPQVDEARKAAIEEAQRNGDMIKLQELMFAEPAPDTPPAE